MKLSKGTQNKQADLLAKAAAQNDPLPPDVFFETLKHGSINCAEEPAKFVNAITSEDWRATIMAYLRGHFIPEDDKEQKRMALHARNYSIINEDLYQGGVCAPSSTAFRGTKADSYSKKSTPECVLHISGPMP